MQQILTPGFDQSTVVVEWQPLLNAAGIGYSVRVSTPNDLDFMSFVTDVPSFNFTARHNTEYTVIVAVDIQCLVLPAFLVFEHGMSS